MEFLQGLLSAVSGLAGVYLGSRLTSRNANKDKLIDLRRRAYGSILSELWEVERVLDVVSDYISEGGWDGYFSSDAEKQHNEQISAHMRSIQKKFSEDYLIVSDNFRGLYEKMHTEMQTLDDTPSYEYDDTFDTLIRKYRPLLLAQAREETVN